MDFYTSLQIIGKYTGKISPKLKRNNILAHSKKLQKQVSLFDKTPEAERFKRRVYLDSYNYQSREDGRFLKSDMYVKVKECDIELTDVFSEFLSNGKLSNRRIKGKQLIDVSYKDKHPITYVIKNTSGSTLRINQKNSPIKTYKMQASSADGQNTIWEERIYAHLNKSPIKKTVHEYNVPNTHEFITGKDDFKIIYPSPNGIFNSVETKEGTIYALSKTNIREELELHICKFHEKNKVISDKKEIEKLILSLPQEVQSELTRNI